jgi:6-phosphogluconolactonase
MQQVIKQFNVTEWAFQSARLIQDTINTILQDQGHCSIMLTGGRSAEQLYMSWEKLSDFRNMSNVQFSFGDERCVEPNHKDSNYGMAMKTLFQCGIPSACSVFRMEADKADRESAALHYSEILPDKIDVLLLGVGEDGHIASLFPGSSALKYVGQRVVPIIGPKLPYERLTITPPVITKSKFVYVLAAGEAKGQVLIRAQQMNNDFDVLPACLILNATWLLDTVL